MTAILLIENNEDINESTCELLELAGYSVITSMDGYEGVRLAKKLNPDVILCDILMPEKDGFEVLADLKRDHQTSHIPFVFFSASTEPKEIERGLKMGAVGYLCKPFTEEELMKTLNRFLD